MRYWQVRRIAALLLVAVLLTIQPGARAARAQEVAPATFIVIGVAGATLRAEPNGSSAALAIVPAGASVTLVGAGVVSHGTVWRQVRTAEGAVGYLPAGFLSQTSGAPVQGAVPAPAPADSRTSGVPAASVGAAPSQAEAAGPASTVATSSGQMSSGSTSDGSRSAAATRGPDPTPTPAAPRTTTERQRGQDRTITRIDTERAPNGRVMGAGRIVVKFQPGAAQAVRTDAHRAAGAATTESLPLPETIVAKVPTGTVAQALAAYRGRPDVVWAEPDYVRRATFMPNDPDFSPEQWNVQKIGAPIAWDITNGANAPKIAILDCGIYSDSSTFKAPDTQVGHPDLRGKVVNEANFSSAADTDDWCNHGTLMAGIAAANTNNSVGVAGVAFNAQLMNGKVLDDLGEGYDSWVASGIVWATQNGAGVISMSLGGEGACNATLQSAIDIAWNAGVVIVAAAGNGGADGVGDPLPEAPGSCNHVIPVGAIDKNDARASFSNYNANPGAGPVVPLAAPGVDTYSTDFRGRYSTVDGTSPATPHVAAVAALVREAYPNESNASIVNRLISTADPIVGTGTFWANGRINAPAAVGGASCSPRPKITVSTTPMGSYLELILSTTGVGNAIRYVQSGGAAGTATNANLIYPSSFSGSPNIAPTTWQGAPTYVPAATSNSTMIHIERQTPGSTTTVPIKVQDVCGTWTTLVGGGTSAGF